MSFIGRRSELKLLEDEYSRQGSSLIVISGVRRVGKTALIRKFIDAKDSFYFLAKEETASSNFRRFVNQIKERNKKEDECKDWKMAFSKLNPRPRSKLIIVIDDFPLLASTDEGVLSTIKDIWGSKANKNIMLILSGTETGLMSDQAMRDYSEIYSSCTASIQLGPLSFMEVSDSFTDLSFKEAVELYIVTGGIPKYIEVLGDGDFRKNLIRHVIGRNGSLHDEPEFILRSEVRELSYYMSIMESIASGDRSIGEIAKKINVQSKILSPYLGVLEEIGMVERELPFTEKDKKRSRMGQYRIKGSFMEFWFKFVYPFKDSVDMGDEDKAKDFLKGHFVDDFISYRYVDVCSDILVGLKDSIGLEDIKIGRYWEGKLSIDLVAVDEKNKVIFAANCIYSKEEVKSSTMADLLNSCGQSKGMKGYTIINGVFSRSGFEDELQNEASENGLILINKMKIV